MNLGDLVEVHWTDASIGKSLASGMAVDIPVVSWGLYLGLMGKRDHIVLVQNNFHYCDDLCDLDYTAIPLSWSSKIVVITKSHISEQDAHALLKSFAAGPHGHIGNRIRRQHLSNHHD